MPQSVLKMGRSTDFDLDLQWWRPSERCAKWGIYAQVRTPARYLCLPALVPALFYGRRLKDILERRNHRSALDHLAT